MRKVLYIALAVMLCGLYAVAQDYPKAELFGGFNLTHLDTENAQTLIGGGVSVKSWYPGWTVAGQFNLTKLLGVKGEFSGNYGTPLTIPGEPFPSARAYTFLFGPVFSFRGDRITPFVHALFGGNHITIDSSAFFGTPSGSETSFAMAFGGGLDVKVSHHFAVRLGQFDFLYTKHCGNLGVLTGNTCVLGTPGFPAAHQNNFRYSAGVVIH